MAGSAKRLMIEGIKLLDFGKKEGGKGGANFSAPALQQIGNNFIALHEAIGCGEEFDDYIPKCDLDGDLLTSSLELVPTEPDFAVFALTGSNELTGCRIHNFKAVRLELKGSSGIGKRYEYRFHISFSDPTGLTKLEGLQNNAPDRPTVIYATYQRQAKQQNLPGTGGDDGKRVEVTDDLRVTPEQAQRVLGDDEDEAEQIAAARLPGDIVN